MSGALSRQGVCLINALLLVVCVACSKDDDGDGKTKPQKLTNAPQCSPTVSMKSIYGADDRRDWFEVKDSVLLNWAHSTVALIYRTDITASATAGKSDIKAEAYGPSRGLCADQPFRDEPIGAYCSGFYVGSDMIVTAGHCITSDADCAKTMFVFDYAIPQPNDLPTQVLTDQVYGCQRIISRSSGTDDYALVQVDRPIKNRVPFQVRRQGQAAIGSQVTMIGHPAGLPSKIADSGTISSVGSRIVADVDAFGGNSGSVIVDRGTGIVEGILVAGNADYDWKGGCYVEHICGADCDGEKIYPIAKVAAFIPNLPSSSTTEKWGPAGAKCSTGLNEGLSENAVSN